VLSESPELGVWAHASKNLSISLGDNAPALALERSGDDCRSAASGARANDFVDEVDELVRETHGYLLAHPNMVAICYRSVGPADLAARIPAARIPAARMGGAVEARPIVER
jgi:hypothetical protein